MATLDLAQLIRERAYRRWEERGREDGNPDDDWLEAEREIKALDRTVEGEVSKDAVRDAPEPPPPGQPI